MSVMDKSAIIESYIMRGIRSRRWVGGERLPAESEMCRELNVGKTSLRVALKTMANRGVIVRRRSSGSFVSHALRARKIIIAVDFNSLASASYIYRRGVDRLKSRIAADDRALEIVLGSGATADEFCSSLGFERRGDLSQVAGVIFLVACGPEMDALLRRLDIPYVDMASTGFMKQAALPGGNHIRLDTSSLFEQAMALFERNGIRDFAMLAVDGRETPAGATAAPDRRTVYADLLEKRGLPADDDHLVMTPWTYDRAEAYQRFKDWWARPARPRALFVAEDFAAKAMLRAVWELGVKVPEELSLVTHSNGERLHAPFELDRVEFNPDLIADRLFDLLRRRMDGAPPEDFAIIRPVTLPGESVQVQARSPSVARPRRSLEVVGGDVYRDAPARPTGHSPWKCETGYSFVDGPRMFEVASDICGRDRYDCFTERFSDDNGRTWGAPREVYTAIKHGGKVHRMAELFQNLDTNTNSLYRLYMEGTFENDSSGDPGLHAFHRTVRLYARRSYDGGGTFSEEEDITRIYRDLHPDGGRLCVSCAHLVSGADGCVRIPVYMEHETAGAARLMIGDPRGKTASPTRTAWRFGGVVPPPEGVPNLRLTEGTLAELPDGRLAAIYRGDAMAGLPNGENLPWRKWITVSEDGGESWSVAREWRYADGSPVCSPSSMPRLVRHSGGRLVFIGNILDRPSPRMESRNTLSAVEVDADSLCALPETRMRIDGREPKDCPMIALSNFTTNEDRATGEIFVYCPVAYRRVQQIEDCVLMRYRLRLRDCPKTNGE